MTKGKEKLVITPATVLACMTPGTRYTLPQIARLGGTNTAEVTRLLSGLILRGAVKQTSDGKHNIYCVQTEDEIRQERERAASHILSQGVLQGYEAEHRRFRELCMAARTPLPGGPGRNEYGQSGE
ncbi:hypothetical protein SAMN05444172_9029 [Burkholderia sp. GAS332]|nr:hypothetical protein SAMN05444172_9029 [Burkholderia sp. GAS332]